MLFSLLLIFCFYLPFQLALNPTAGVDLASGRIFILLLLFFWLADGLKNRKLFVRNNFVNFFIVSFLALNLISFSVARNIDWSLRKSLFLFSVFPLYFVFSGVIGSGSQRDKITKALVYGGFVVATLAFIQFISQFIFGLEAVYQFWATNISPIFLGHNVMEAVLKNPSWLVNISGKTYLRATATFPDPHMLAFFLGMLIPLSLGLYLKNKKIIYAIIFVTMLLADLLTFSRGGYLGLFFGAVVIFGASWQRLKRRYQIVFSLIFFVGVIMGSIPGPISERFLSSFNFKEGSNLGRIETWKKAQVIISNHPLFGVGIGNYPLVVNPKAEYRDPIYAHSLYLDIAAETGLISLYAWLGMIIALFVSFIRKAKKDILFFCAMLSVAIFSAHALVETPLYSPIILPLFLIIASFNVIEESNEKTA